MKMLLPLKKTGLFFLIWAILFSIPVLTSEIFAAGHGCATNEPDRDGDGVPDKDDSYPDDPARTGKEEEEGAEDEDGGKLKSGCGDQVPAMRLFFIPFGQSGPGGAVSFAGIESSSVTSLVACSNDGIGGSIKNILGHGNPGGGTSPAGSPSTAGSSTGSGSGSGTPQTFPPQDNLGIDPSGGIPGTTSGVFPPHETVLKLLDCSTRTVKGQVVLCEEFFMETSIPSSEAGIPSSGTGTSTSTPADTPTSTTSAETPSAPVTSENSFWPPFYDQIWRDAKCGQKDSAGLLNVCVPTDLGVIVTKTDPAQKPDLVNQLTRAGVPLPVIAGILSGGLGPSLPPGIGNGLWQEYRCGQKDEKGETIECLSFGSDLLVSNSPSGTRQVSLVSLITPLDANALPPVSSASSQDAVSGGQPAGSGSSAPSSAALNDALVKVGLGSNSSLQTLLNQYHCADKDSDGYRVECSFHSGMLEIEKTIASGRESRFTDLELLAVGSDILGLTASSAPGASSAPNAGDSSVSPVDALWKKWQCAEKDENGRVVECVRTESGIIVKTPENSPQGQAVREFGLVPLGGMLPAETIAKLEGFSTKSLTSVSSAPSAVSSDRLSEILAADFHCAGRDPEGRIVECSAAEHGLLVQTMLLSGARAEEADLGILAGEHARTAEPGMLSALKEMVVSGEPSSAVQEMMETLWTSQRCGSLYRGRAVECFKKDQLLFVRSANEQGTAEVYSFFAAPISGVDSAGLAQKIDKVVFQAQASSGAGAADGDSHFSAMKEIFQCGEKDLWGRLIECRSTSNGLAVSTLLGTGVETLQAFGFMPASSGWDAESSGTKIQEVKVASVKKDSEDSVRAEALSLIWKELKCPSKAEEIKEVTCTATDAGVLMSRVSAQGVLKIQEVSIYTSEFSGFESPSGRGSSQASGAGTAGDGENLWEEARCGQYDEDGYYRECRKVSSGVLIFRTLAVGRNSAALGEKTKEDASAADAVSSLWDVFSKNVKKETTVFSRNLENAGEALAALWETEGCGQEHQGNIKRCLAASAGVITLHYSSAGTLKIHEVSLAESGMGTVKTGDGQPASWKDQLAKAKWFQDAALKYPFLQEWVGGGKNLPPALSKQLQCGEKDKRGYLRECRKTRYGIVLSSLIYEGAWSASGAADEKDSVTPEDAFLFTLHNRRGRYDDLAAAWNYRLIAGSDFLPSMAKGATSFVQDCGYPDKRGVYKKCFKPLPGQNKKLDRDQIRLKVEFPPEKTIFYADAHGVVLKTHSERNIVDMSYLSPAQMAALEKEIEKTSGGTFAAAPKSAGI